MALRSRDPTWEEKRRLCNNGGEEELFVQKCVFVEGKRWNTRFLESGDTRSVDFICTMTDIDDFSRDNSFLQVESYGEFYF